MALALLANTAPRIIAILGANPGVWSPNVSGRVGAFPSDPEILAATLEADEWVVTQCYFQSKNASLSEGFDVTQQLGQSDPLPFHHGKHSKIELSANEATWVDGIRTDKDSVINAKAIESYVESSAFDFLYSLDDNQFRTTQNFGRITYPEYIRTSVLQANKNEESLIIFRAVAILAKNASPALFDKYDGFAELGRKQIVEDGAYTGGEE